ncbi:protein scarlet-like [Adelges cooleyi]|uniref:protein scarlet-like n=1 Tax=Adelges cooleyi TaxID=133065 RepID=UPI0021807E6C|nr:protein scarlet-like [Adelges cooleyi]
MSPKTMLDLRYNEMWNDWDGSAGDFGEPVILEQQQHGRLVLSWKRLNVSVTKKVHRLVKPTKVTSKQLLFNVSGNIESGKLLGIMGPSGSGKTTLMATISHRTKGNFDGELLLNGQPVSEENMIKISGFVPQQDLSFEQLTTLEHLIFMAKLKMDRCTNEKALAARIEYLVAKIGMNNFLDTRLMYLSGGERKKVALSVQLLNDPPILFCDEITTGLDSYSAAHIVNTLKSIARTGKIVVCTIHQPASGVFDKFDDVVLLSNGRLAYQGPVSLVNQFFKKFDYTCPDMFNKADFVVSVLNSNEKSIKSNVDEMCRISSTEYQIDSNYDSYNCTMQLEYQQLLHPEKQQWITQLNLILGRSVKCFLRSYKAKILELITLLFLGLFASTPYANLKFDTKAVQNWQGFWFSFTINSMFQYCYSSIITYQLEFPIVHREVSNSIYSLSAFYVSEIVMTLVWTIVEVLMYTYLVFWIVGIGYNYMQVMTFLIIMLAARSYGSVLSAYFERLESVVMFSLVYDYLAVSLSGAYISFSSIPPLLYYLKYFSLFFLACESLSILQWRDSSFIPCLNLNNCLHNGKEVLLSYGYDIDRLYVDLISLFVFYIIAYVLGYYGILRRTKKQPAY